jgi:hypothetical protein
MWSRASTTISLSPHDVLLVAFATATGIGAALYSTGLIRFTSPYFGIAISLVMFTLAPGYLLSTLLQARSPQQYGFLTLVLLSTSLGLTWNFLANVAVYLTRPNIARVVSVYVTVVTVGYAVALIMRFVVNHGGQPYRVAVAPLPVTIVGICVCLIYILLLHREPSFFHVEEFAVVRKILSVPAIAYDNIAFNRGDRTTYFFVPFYLLIAIITTFLDVDLFVGYPALWPFTALMSLACIAKLSQLVSGRWEPAAILLALTLVAALFMTVRPSILTVDLLPFADRYSVAPGLLLPLALFHFLMHVHDERFNWAMMTGLVYLLVENTFVHAKETLYALGIFLTYLVMLTIAPDKDRGRITRTLLVIGLAAVLLAGYAVVNVLSNEELLTHIFTRRTLFTATFVAGWKEYGLLYFFLPEFLPDRFYDTFVRLTVVQGETYWLRALIILLPFYVALVSRFDALLVPIAGSAMVLCVASAGLSHAAIAIFGEPDVLRIGPTLAAINVVVAVHLLWILRPGRWWAWFAAWWRDLSVRIGFSRALALLLAATTIVVVIALLAFHGFLQVWFSAGRNPYAFTGSQGLDTAIFCSVIALGIVRIAAGHFQTTKWD